MRKSVLAILALAAVCSAVVVLAPSEPTAAASLVCPCDASCNIITGTRRADYLVGTNGCDCINGLGGDDTILGLGGDDSLCGSSTSTLDGGAGKDICVGGGTVVNCEL